MKKICALSLSLAMLLALAACQGTPALLEESKEKKTNAAAAVYFLNPEPALDAQWQELAGIYSQQTGTQVTVVTPEAGSYEKVLADEMPGIEAPTLFTIPGAASPWAAYAWDLTGSDVYHALSSEGLAVEKDGAVLAVPYHVDAYGLLVNCSILERMEWPLSTAGSFEGIKKVAQNITGRQGELDWAAFAAPGLGSSEEPGPAAMLANVALWLNGDGERSADSFKTIWDIYMNNSTCAPSELADRDPAQGLKEFIAGKAVFYLTGDWDYAAARAAMPEAELMVVPVYIGAGDEESQGLCVGAESYWCVNKEADLDDIEVTLDFMKWCVSSGDGVAALEAMGYVLPYKAATVSSNPFISQGLNGEGRTPVPWVFASAPEGWESELNAALAAYASGGSWDGVAAVYTGA